MKILFVSTMAGHPWGGSEELWARSALQLKQEGHQIEATVCSVQTSPRPVKIEQLLASGIPVRVSSFKVTGLTILRDAALRRLRRFPNLYWRVDKTSKWILEAKPDLVVFSDGSNMGNISWFQTCIANNIPYVTIAQAVIETAWPDDAAAHKLREAMENAKRCFFVSQANLETTRLQVGSKGENFEVIRNPFNVDYDVDLPWPDQADSCRMAFVGRLEPAAKGCDVLLSALACPQWKSRNIELHFYGGGANAEGVRKMAELLNVKNCFFHGHVSNIMDIWKENHLLVLPSRYEGLPLAVVEAMLCGRPCVVTNVSGNAELIEDGVTGFVAAGVSTSSLNETLERAWDVRQDWKKMGELASESVRLQVPNNPINEFVLRLKDSIRN